MFLHLQDRRISELTPIAGMKAVKNPTEIQGMKNAHVCKFMC